MDKKILNEINRNRQLMGIMEQPQSELVKKGKFADVNYEMYKDVTKFFMGPFSIDNEGDMKKVFLDRLEEIGIPESECSPLKVGDKTVSCEIETTKVKELLGLNSPELNEQGFIDALKRGVDKGKEFAKKLFNKNDDEVTDTETENTETPIKVEEYKQSTIKTYNDYITVEVITPGNREIAQKIINSIAREKGLGEPTKREFFYLDEGGSKVISYFNK